VSNESQDGYNPFAATPILAATPTEHWRVPVTVRVSIDPDLCTGSTECVRMLPAAFELDDEAGVSHPLPDAPAVPVDELVAAARNCPTNAISVEADGIVLVAAAE
jgi:ferredoxin